MKNSALIDGDVVEVVGHVDANLSMSQIVLSVFLGNMLTGLVGGAIWLIVSTAT